VLQIRSQHHGLVHINVAWTLNSYGQALFAHGEITEALIKHEEALETFFLLRTPLGNMITYIKCRIVLFLLPDQSPCDNVEKKKRMSTLLQEVVGFQNSVLGALSPRIAETRYLLGLHTQQILKQYDSAIRYFKESSCIRKSSLGNQCVYALD